MRVIDLDHTHQRNHFEFFSKMNHPHFSICAPIDVTEWVAHAKRRGHRLSTTLVYLLSRAANSVPQFRQRIREGQLVEHECVHPSFAVPTEGTDVFSFCEVDFVWQMLPFLERAEVQIEAMRASPSIADEEGRDDYLFMSALPWVSFTAVTHPMQFHPHDSVPRISWGKITTAGERLLMPVSVQAHHAVVDGIHMGRLFEGAQELAHEPRQALNR